MPLDLYVQPVAWVVLQERTFPRHDLRIRLGKDQTCGRAYQCRDVTGNSDVKSI